MRKFKVKEKFTVTQWTYVKAETHADAVTQLEGGESYDNDVIDEEWQDTDWDTFEEVT